MKLNQIAAAVLAGCLLTACSTEQEKADPNANSDLISETEEAVTDEAAAGEETQTQAADAEHTAGEDELTADSEVTENSNAAAKDISENASAYYGKVITNYHPSGEADPNLSWKIFLADENRIYLIASDCVKSPSYVPEKGFDFSDGIAFDELKYNAVYENRKAEEIIARFDADTVSKWHKWIANHPDSTNKNVKAVSLLLDTEEWSMYQDADFSDYAIGSPTAEMLIQSYTDTHPDVSITLDYSASEHGYTFNMGDDGYYTECGGLDREDALYAKLSSAQGIWLASPSASGISPEHDLADNQVMMFVFGTFTHDKLDGSLYTCGLRPVIALQSGVAVEPDGEGYKLIK